MDPLSAYRSVSGGLGPAMPNLQEDSINKMIPKSELDKLPSSSPLADLPSTRSLGPSSSVSGESFSSFLGNVAHEVSAKQAAAGSAMREVMAGGHMPLHQAMIAVQEASVSFQLMVEVRNKLLDAYQELMRMQV